MPLALRATLAMSAGTRRRATLRLRPFPLAPLPRPLVSVGGLSIPGALSCSEAPWQPSAAAVGEAVDTPSYLTLSDADRVSGANRRPSPSVLVGSESTPHLWLVTPSGSGFQARSVSTNLGNERSWNLEGAVWVG